MHSPIGILVPPFLYLIQFECQTRAESFQSSQGLLEQLNLAIDMDLAFVRWFGGFSSCTCSFRQAIIIKDSRWLKVWDIRKFKVLIISDVKLCLFAIISSASCSCSEALNAFNDSLLQK